MQDISHGNNIRCAQIIPEAVTSDHPDSIRHACCINPPLRVRRHIRQVKAVEDQMGVLSSDNA
jgi:hypothetical protein